MSYADALRPTRRSSAAIFDLSTVVMGSLLLTAGAQIAFYLPFSPVPVTLQSLALLMVAATLGSRRGAASVLLYLGQGLAGLPVFAGFLAGPAVLVGPTAGYLIGFVPAALVVGLLAERGLDRRLRTALPLMLLGTAIVFLFGALWLGLLIGYDKVLVAGVLPFMPGAVIKLAIAAAALPAGWKLLRRFRPEQ